MRAVEKRVNEFTVQNENYSHLLLFQAKDLRTSLAYI